MQNSFWPGPSTRGLLFKKGQTKTKQKIWTGRRIRAKQSKNSQKAIKCCNRSRMESAKIISSPILSQSVDAAAADGRKLSVEPWKLGVVKGRKPISFARTPFNVNKSRTQWRIDEVVILISKSAEISSFIKWHWNPLRFQNNALKGQKIENFIYPLFN